jgi:pimeloyl-ACP methyl ester carboxylesterase
MDVFTLPDGRRLKYWTYGENGSPVVLLHGYSDSHGTFFRQIEALAARHLVVAPDQRGHGESDLAAEYSMAGFAADALALLEHLNLGPVHLGGHSLGGIVAQRVAAARPELVKSLALISTARTSGGNAVLLEAVPVVAGLSDPVPEAVLREFQGSTTHVALPEEIFEEYLKETRKLKAEVWRGALAGLVEEVPPEEAPSEIPTVILWGEHDGFFGAADQAALRAHFVNAKFVEFKNAGHAPNWEQPEGVGKALLDFWSEVDG